MGSMSSKGVFSAQLDPFISELGEGGGSVRAMWKDTDGRVIHGESGLIHVIQKIDDTEERG